jgi:hypothetical protein
MVYSEVRLLYNGTIDVATIYWQLVTWKSINLEPVHSIVLLAYPVIRLREGRSLTDLTQKLDNLSNHFLVIYTIRIFEFVHYDVASVERQWVWNNIQGCWGLIDQLASIRNNASSHVLWFLPVFLGRATLEGKKIFYVADLSLPFHRSWTHGNLRPYIALWTCSWLPKLEN